MPTTATHFADDGHPACNVDQAHGHNGTAQATMDELPGAAQQGERVRVRSYPWHEHLQGERGYLIIKTNNEVSPDTIVIRGGEGGQPPCRGKVEARGGPVRGADCEGGSRGRGGPRDRPPAPPLMTVVLGGRPHYSCFISGRGKAPRGHHLHHGDRRCMITIIGNW